MEAGCRYTGSGYPVLSGTSPTIGRGAARHYQQRPGWKDGTAIFWAMIRERLSNGNNCVLDVGAGAGNGYYRPKLPMTLVGIDLMPELKNNLQLDQKVRGDAEQMPFRDNSFDLVFSSYVLEHLHRPSRMIREARRVLKPGGWLLLRTPNKWHYTVLGALLVPGYVQGWLLAALQPERQPEDIFPKHYRCNTEGEVRRALEDVGFLVDDLRMVEREPSYLMRWPALASLGIAYEKLVNSTPKMGWARSNIFVAARKPLQAN